jgi:putative nucleotidyltransferase with HDIG domain
VYRVVHAVVGYFDVEAQVRSGRVQLLTVPGFIDELLQHAQTAARGGDREIARRRYECALYLLRTSEDSVHAPTILRRVGRLYVDDGDYGAAADCIVASVAVAESLGDPGAVAHATNVLAISHWQRGDLEKAEQWYLEARRLAERVGDAKLIAVIEQNLGFVANARGEIGLALDHFQKSLREYQALGLSRHAGPLLNQIGMAHADLEQWEAAAAAYDAAIQSSENASDGATTMAARTNRVEMLIALRDFDRARGESNRLLEDAESARDSHVLAETYKLLGVIAVETNALSEAEHYLDLAQSIAVERGDYMLAAEALRELAECHATRGESRAALSALTTAHRLFEEADGHRAIGDIVGQLERLENRFLQVVEQWSESIESKDRYTLGHCRRVSTYACAVARDMGLDEASLFWFRVGALLHDVGKLTVPSEILNKPSALDPRERALLERHPQAGVELLADVAFPPEVFAMIRAHHERWDGTGYPDRLAGAGIPIAARILCVADVYDALTTDRPYRNGYTRDHALGLMRRDEGRVFDPDVLARFERVVRMLPEQRASSDRSRPITGAIEASTLTRVGFGHDDRPAPRWLHPEPNAD